MTIKISQTILSPWLTPVRVISLSNIAGIYSNGIQNDGHGARLVIAASSLTIDDVVLSVSDRVLLAAQNSSNQNGIYIVEEISSVVILERASDQQLLEQYKAGQYVSVGAGTDNAGHTYTIVEPLPSRLGIDALIWVATAASGGGGGIVLPTKVNHIATYTDTAGTLSEDAATAINAGNIQAGLSTGTAGEFRSYTSSATGGSLGLRATDTFFNGNHTITVEATFFGQDTTYHLIQPSVASTNIIVSDKAGTQHITSGSLTIDTGNFTVAQQSIFATTGNFFAGSDTFAGTFYSYSGQAASGSLRLLAAINASGDFNTTISNATAIGQSQVISIPDVGASTGKFIVSDVPALGGQTIGGDLEISDGLLVIGKSDDSGQSNSLLTITSQTANKGTLNLEMTNNTGNFNTIITNAAMGQHTTIVVPNPANANARFLVAPGSTPFTSGNFPAASGTDGLMIDSGVSAASLSPLGKVTYVDMNVTAAGLAMGGKVYVVMPTANTYKVRYFISYSDGQLFGGGGDQNLLLWDSVTPFVLITSGQLQAPSTVAWGDVGGTVLIESVNVATVSGNGFWFEYNGGTTDYTDGTVNFTIAYERIT